MARKSRKTHPSRSWDNVATWYTGWSGAGGSLHHRRLAIPAAMQLLNCAAGENLLDLGCGPGALARSVRACGARYTGVDLSNKLITFARRHNGGAGTRFLHGDATRVPAHPSLRPGNFDAAVFLLSLQDINPLPGAINSAAWSLRAGGRLVIVMTHPCFRIPRQSGWGRDQQRGLNYRRVDRYLTPLDIPMQPHPGGRGVTRSFHRPLSAYMDALAGGGFMLDRLLELPAHETGGRAAHGAQGNDDIPLFLGLRAVLPPTPTDPRSRGPHRGSC